MLSELAALGICVCFVVLGAHLVLSVLTALGIYVMFCGAWSAPGAVSACCTWHMCWLYVVLGAHLCVGYMYCGVLGCVGYMYCGVLGCVGYMYCGVLVAQEGSGPCKIPKFSHLLGSYGTYTYFVRHVRIDLRQS